MARTSDLVAAAVRRFEAEVPALKRLKLVFRLELRARGDVQVFRVRVPGPEVTKEEPEDARVDVSIQRSTFNELAEDGGLRQWVEAFEQGDVKVGGNRDIQRLVGTVIERQMARSGLRRAD